MAQLIFNLGVQLPHSANGHFFLEHIMTVYSQQQVRDQASRDIDHQTVRTTGDQMVNLQVSFPVGKEVLYVPLLLLCWCDIFCK